MLIRSALLAAVVLFSAGFVTASAQELDATVVVNADMLQLDQRQEIQTMSNDVRTYLNNQRYTGDDWDGPRIPVSVTIYLSGRNGNTYTGRLAIVSKRLVSFDSTQGSALLRVFDQEWVFQWSFNPTLTYQLNRFDGFTSVIDFYMLLAIGLDMDTYEDLGGSRMYDFAKQIAQLGNAAGISQFSSSYQPGEFTRMALVTELTDIRYQGLRRLIYDYHVAIDDYAENKIIGRDNVANVIKNLAAYKKQYVSNRSVMLQAFFDAKSQELADIFSGQRTSTVWDDLRFLDPGNTQLYEQARSK